MECWIHYLPWLVGMGLLLGVSGFFSGSEAALFSLTPTHRRQMSTASQAQQLAVRLLQNPERVLTAILFWNLLTNVLYFTIASILGLQIQRKWGTGSSGTFALGAVGTLIVLGEILPKTLAVVRPQWVASWVSFPLQGAIRLVDPLLPVLRQLAQLSQRVLCPQFEPEPYLQVRDLERAVELSAASSPSSGNTHWLREEQEVLQGLVWLSEMRVEELMRPRKQLVTFKSSVNWTDIHQNPPPGGYVFLTDPQTEEIIGLVDLRQMPAETLPLAQQAKELLYVPWCISVAEALQQMTAQGHCVAVVVNEYGETIGVLTLEDVWESIFQPSSSRSQRLFRRPALRAIAPGVWEATGITSLRRIARHLRIERPSCQATTVAGLFLEQLGRFPVPGDTCRWGPVEFRVTGAWQPGQMLVEVRLCEEEPSSWRS